MNEDIFNMSVRKFLKQVGINGQREIESAVRDAIAEGTLAGNETLSAKVTLTLSKTKLDMVIQDEIRLDGTQPS
jgi:hypothetical protein